MLFRSTALFLSLGASAISQPTVECPINGPALPADFDITKSKAFQDAVAGFPAQIDKLFSAGTLNKSATSFAIDIFSTQTNSSVYFYQHSGSTLDSARTKGVIDDGTLFRIGSVSKLFTVYALLAKSGIAVLEEPVVKFLPELKGNNRKDGILWEEVTVGALAAQMAGAGGFALDQTLCFNPPPELPLPPCSTESFLTQMRDRQYARSPVFQTGLYADSGFGVLGRVLERITNKTYNDAIKSVLGEPLGLKDITSFKPPSEGLNALALPGNESSWGFDNQITAPSGGIYANAHDLRLLGQSILHSSLLPSVHTRQWLKPHSLTSSLAAAVGAPWEIYRLALPVSASSNRTRISDVYTKTGGQTAYGTVFALSPDHKLGFNILIAGPTAVTDRVALRELVGATFLTAAEHSAWDNAKANYAGTFAVPNNSTINMTLSVDPDSPGLGLISLNALGFDILGQMVSPAYVAAPKGTVVRLYPSGTEFKGAGGKSNVKIFNAVAEINPGPRVAAEGGVGLFNSECETWLSTGFFESTTFEFEVVDGKLASVKWPYFDTTVSTNVTLVRV